jgi:hypothetical protein
MTVADRGHRPPRPSPARLRERLEAILRDRAQDLVVVAAGNDGLDADGAARIASNAQRAAGDNGMLGASIAADTPTPRTVWRDRRRGHRTHPSPRWHDRERFRASACAAAARDSVRSASSLRAAASASARRTAPPLRISSPSAASPIVPVTTTRSPGFAPLRWTILPGGHAPERGDRDHQRTRRGNRIAAEQRTAEHAPRPRRARARTAL